MVCCTILCRRAAWCAARYSAGGHGVLHDTLQEGMVCCTILCRRAWCAARYSAGGHGVLHDTLQEGIFRLSADETERSAIKRKLDQAMPVAEAVAQASAVCCAALIKAYLRELPDDLWREVRPHLDHLLQNGVGDVPGALSPSELLQYLPAPERDVLYWLCDCAAEVARYQASNKMHVGAIAVVHALGLPPLALAPAPSPPPGTR